MIIHIPFFKVLVVQIDIFESVIIGEHHFSNRSEAKTFANQQETDNIITIIVEV